MRRLLKMLKLGILIAQFKKSDVWISLIKPYFRNRWQKGGKLRKNLKRPKHQKTISPYIIWSHRAESNR